MEDVLPFNADNTHLYPGARLTAPDGGEAFSDHPKEVIVVFSDHSHAEAVLASFYDNAFVLHVEAYSTAAGTAISARSWHVAVTGDRTLTVKSRTDRPAS